MARSSHWWIMMDSSMVMTGGGDLAWPRFERLLKKMEPRICMEAAAVGASSRPWRWCWGLDRADGVRTDACHVMVLCYHAVNGADWLLAADGRTCCKRGVLLVESKADAGFGQIAHVRLLVVRDAGHGAIVPRCRCVCHGG
ncbi:hypothetical protein ACLOJK_019167 [Asimina triloba]